MTLRDAAAAVSGQEGFLYYRSMLSPTILRALRLIDHEYTTVRRPKGYNLLKRGHKRQGFVYYVRYWHEGKMLPSKWSTHTNDYEKACEFAKQQRKALICGYLALHRSDVQRFFEEFYDIDSPVYESECRRNGELREEKRKRYRSVIVNEFVPLLRQRGIRTFEEIDVPFLDDFQDMLLSKGMKAVSVNNQLVAIGKVMKYLTRKGLIKINPYINLSPVPARQEEKRTHGCYEIARMKGVFNDENRWDDKTSYILNLIIHTTDMRNSEIRRFHKKDIKEIDGCRFIEIIESKTLNGIRLIPLHNFVHDRIKDYAKGIHDEALVFDGFSSCHKFVKASQDLGKILGVSAEYMKQNNITFYSGRHFWKTLMNANGLGEDVEEIFMGHRVSSNVSKLYNHRDKQGKDLIVRKAREVFAILDSCIF
jgi:site-specific recombinase XerD